MCHSDWPLLGSSIAKPDVTPDRVTSREAAHKGVMIQHPTFSFIDWLLLNTFVSGNMIDGFFNTNNQTKPFSVLMNTHDEYMEPALQRFSKDIFPICLTNASSGQACKQCNLYFFIISHCTLPTTRWGPNFGNKPNKSGTIYRYSRTGGNNIAQINKMAQMPNYAQ